MSSLISALGRLIMLTIATAAVLLVILGNTIAMNVRLHAINAKFSAFNDRATAISEKLAR